MSITPMTNSELLLSAQLGVNASASSESKLTESRYLVAERIGSSNGCGRVWPHTRCEVYRGGVSHAKIVGSELNEVGDPPRIPHSARARTRVRSSESGIGSVSTSPMSRAKTKRTELPARFLSWPIKFAASLSG